MSALPVLLGVGAVIALVVLGLWTFFVVTGLAAADDRRHHTTDDR